MTREIKENDRKVLREREEKRRKIPTRKVVENYNYNGKVYSS